MRKSSLEFTGKDGLRLAGDGFGDPRSDPVLLLHGGGQTRHAWGNTATVLADRGWYAVTIDLRGHGDSEWSPEGDYRAQANVDDVRAVVARLGGRPALVGASLGGQAALLAEGEPPGSVSAAVVLVDITPRVEPEGVVRIVRFMQQHPEGFASLDEAAAAVRGYLPHREEPPTPEGLAKNLRQHADGRWRWHWDPRLLDNQLGPAVEDRELLIQRARTWGERMLAAARSLAVPTLLVRGMLSDVVSEAGVEEFRSAVPHAEYTDVSRAGHMVAGDRNDAFTEVVVEFLLRHYPPGHGGER